MKSYLAEFLGTFALVFCGTGAIIINEQTHGVIGHIGIAITFGAIIASMIYTFANLSGAHFNPAVTLAFSIIKLFPARKIAPYLISQIAGAFAATLVLKMLFSENQNLGSTLPAGSNMQSFVLEFILTYFLMLTILFTSQGPEKTQQLAGLAIGTVILLEAMFAGPICGASMNPARSLAPGLVSGNIQTIWIYLLAPVFGSLSASFSYKFLTA
jgi:aquaporin NIP